MNAGILIADDHQQYRSVLRTLLVRAGYHVVGEAADAAEAIAKVDRLRPDMILLDVQLPDRDGIAVAAELGARADPPQIILISSRHPSDYGSRLESTVVLGFIHKPDLTRASIERLIGRPFRG